ncbi:peptide deformylase [Streptomyces reniochalinae]
MTATAMPFRTAIRRGDEDGRRVFSWSTEDPPLHARYRLEWKFKNPQSKEEIKTDVTAARPSDRMQEIGIVQEGDPVLTKTAREFALPDEAEDARRVVAELVSATERAATVHNFGKGMGIAAPQIGIDRAAAIVRTLDGENVTLLNPRYVEESVETDEQYEGCLSFFDVRGMVPRPLSISVEHTDIDGQKQITIFERGVARLVATRSTTCTGCSTESACAPASNPSPSPSTGAPAASGATGRGGDDRLQGRAHRFVSLLRREGASPVRGGLLAVGAALGAARDVEAVVASRRAPDR